MTKMSTNNWPEPYCNTTPWPFSVPAGVNRPPWLERRPVPIHVAQTKTVACGPGLLRAADADRRGSR